MGPRFIGASLTISLQWHRHGATVARQDHASFHQQVSEALGKMFLFWLLTLRVSHLDSGKAISFSVVLAQHPVPPGK